MSMTYTKLFSSITESTIWCEDAWTRLVWITMLAMADRKGRVFASIPGLANRARVPLADCEAALRKLLSPDEYSRTKEHDGRRIAEIDGGWELLNYAKYRAIRDEETILEAKRRYINTRRAIERQGVENVEQGRTLYTQAEAEAEAEAEAGSSSDSSSSPSSSEVAVATRVDAKRERRKALGHFVPETFVVSDEERDWARSEYPKLDLFRETQKFRDHEFKTERSDWHRAWRNWIRRAGEQARG